MGRLASLRPGGKTTLQVAKYLAKWPNGRVTPTPTGLRSRLGQWRRPSRAPPTSAECGSGGVEGGCAEHADRRRNLAGLGDSLLESAVGAIVKAAKTGKIGDGKVFVSPVEEAIRIRTDETGEKAV
jgi:hypothetical protein